MREPVLTNRFLFPIAIGVVFAQTQAKWARAQRELSPVQDSCGLSGAPAGQAHSLNITVVPQGALAYLSIWPTSEAHPVVSTLNADNGQVVANAAIVPVGGNGSIDVYVTNTTDVVIDTTGYFGP